MRFEVLGTVQAIVDAQVVAPISELRRRLLAVLLVRANRAVPVETLAEALWGDEPPNSPSNSLQVHVHRLRQVLDRPERLRGVPGGYLLEVGPDEFDAVEFTDRHTAARNAVAAGELERAVPRFRSALALWRGTPYGDVTEPRVVAAEANRLAEARLIAYEELYDAELALSRAREIVPELTELVASYPLRERIVGQLMLALYRSGRQSRAEMTYQATRRRLAQELRAEPGRALRELFESIRSENPELDGPPARTGATPAQLPPAPGAFLGRETELAALDAAADGPIVLSGMAGVGKTTLALHFAHHVADRYGDGQLYVDLRGHSPAPALEPLDALGHLLRGLGREQVPESVTDAANEYRTLIAGRKMLILLDNAASPEQVRPLLPAGSSCRTLVTSRTRMTGLVAREGAHRLELGTLEMAVARDLLNRLLGTQRVEAEPAPVAELIEACAGLPLALRIAAAQLTDEPHRTIADYLLELQERGLAAFALSDDEQSAVAGAFDLSYHRLEPAVRRLFRLAGLVPGLDFTAPAVAAMSGLSAADARAALRTLTGAHLVDEHAAGRYRFHDLLRDYARSRALTEETEPQRADAMNRLCTWYYRGREVAARLLIAWRLEPPCPPLPDVPVVQLASRTEARGWLRDEFDNIHAAIRDCADHGPVHWCWHLAIGVVADMERYGRRVDVLSMLDMVVTAARAANDQQAVALSLGELGITSTGIGRPVDPEQITQLVTAAEQAGDDAILGFGLYAAGTIELRRTDRPAAREYLQRAREVQERADDTVGQSLTLLQLGFLSYQAGDLGSAVDAWERSVDLAGEEAPSIAVAGVLYACHGRTTLGRLDGIDELFERGRRLVEELDDTTRQCVIGYLRASLLRDTGHPREGRDMLLAVRELADELDVIRPRALIRNELGFCHLMLGEFAAAREAFEEAAELASADLLREYRAHAVRGLAVTALAGSDLDSAESLARDAVELATGSDRMQEGEAIVVLARVKQALGETEAAGELAAQALSILEETGYALGIARAHHALGEIRADRAHLLKALHRFEAFGSPEAATVRKSLTDV
ncbi:BTAD domain-containing putative transcriptional regulator [Kribbella yunnanensis]|uniref:BTAD domain-containing putative transcriptional regulator n=1 Tax=Kribbella yunnanensis TaxID=190194 RepID=A0ABP4U3F6_9ACTN